MIYNHKNWGRHFIDIDEGYLLTHGQGLEVFKFYLESNTINCIWSMRYKRENYNIHNYELLICMRWEGTITLDNYSLRP